MMQITFGLHTCTHMHKQTDTHVRKDLSPQPFYTLPPPSSYTHSSSFMPLPSLSHPISHCPFFSFSLPHTHLPILLPSSLPLFLTHIPSLPISLYIFLIPPSFLTLIVPHSHSHSLPASLSLTQIFQLIHNIPHQTPALQALVLILPVPLPVPIVLIIISISLPLVRLEQT